MSFFNFQKTIKGHTRLTFKNHKIQDEVKRRAKHTSIFSWGWIQAAKINKIKVFLYYNLSSKEGKIIILRCKYKQILMKNFLVDIQIYKLVKVMMNNN